jgi:hypothetical protein
VSTLELCHDDGFARSGELTLEDSEEVAVVSKANGREQSDDDRSKRASDEMASRPAESEEAMQEATAIPKFDLAEQIMAEQRKIAATRRRGPGKRANPPKQERFESIARTIEPLPVSSEQGQIIAEIVARDIRTLCGGDASSPRR